MKRMIWIFVLSLFLTSVFSQNTTRSTYDGNGRKTGTVNTDNKGNETHYDSNGQKQGTKRVMWLYRYFV